MSSGTCNTKELLPSKTKTTLLKAQAKQTNQLGSKSITSNQFQKANILEQWFSIPGGGGKVLGGGGRLCPPGDIWQCLEIFGVVTTERVLLVGRGQGCC